MLFQINLVFGLLLNPVSETVLVPLDHGDPESRKIAIAYHFENEFEKDRETIFSIDDPIDEAFRHFALNDSIKAQFNWVRISGRHFSDDLQKFIKENADGDWRSVYRWLNQNQVAKDIELIRKRILGEKKVNLIGYSSSAGLFLHYLSTHSDSVAKLMCMNPFLMDIQTNLGFWNFSGYFENQSTVLTDAEFFDFAYHSSIDYFNSDPSVRDSLISHAMKSFKEKRSNPPDVKFPLSFAVRTFEHTIELVEKSKSHDPVSNFLREKSKPLWESHSEKEFPLIGTNYDVGLTFKGQVVIFGSTFDLLVNPKVVDVLAEFFPESTLILFRDGHSLKNTREVGEFSDLLLAFLKNDFEMKVKAWRI